jgi:uncharacterized membrane protein YeaQ/YmgE (transglycosylase-associated protein family)
MNIILWVVLGALAGWIASLVMHTDAQQGALMNIILGIVGAFVGGLVLNMFGATGVSGFNIYSILVATIGHITGERTIFLLFFCQNLS